MSRCGTKPARQAHASGQALVELAIFGTLLLLVLGFLVNYGLNADYRQSQMMRAQREALALAWGPADPRQPCAPNDPQCARRGSANVVVVDDRHIPSPSHPFGLGQLVTVNESANVVRTNRLNQTPNSIFALPRTFVLIGGCEVECLPHEPPQAVGTARLVPSPPNAPTTGSGGAWDGGIGCTTAGFRIEHQVPEDSVARYKEIYGARNVCSIAACGGGDECLEWQCLNRRTGETTPGLCGTGPIIPPDVGEWVDRDDPTDPDQFESLCLKNSKRLVIMDACEGELINYEQCVQQAAQIADTGACVAACERARTAAVPTPPPPGQQPPPSPTSCTELCAQPMGLPWYAKGVSVQGPNQYDALELNRFVGPPSAADAVIGAAPHVPPCHAVGHQVASADVTGSVPAGIRTFGLQSTGRRTEQMDHLLQRSEGHDQLTTDSTVQWNAWMDRVFVYHRKPLRYDVFFDADPTHQYSVSNAQRAFVAVPHLPKAGAKRRTWRTPW